MTAGYLEMELMVELPYAVWEYELEDLEAGSPEMKAKFLSLLKKKGYTDWKQLQKDLKDTGCKIESMTDFEHAQSGGGEAGYCTTAKIVGPEEGLRELAEKYADEIGFDPDDEEDQETLEAMITGTLSNLEALRNKNAAYNNLEKLRESVRLLDAIVNGKNAYDQMLRLVELNETGNIAKGIQSMTTVCALFNQRGTLPRK